MTKMTRIALAALAVMGATTAMAQSSVTLYGRINTTVEHQKLGDQSTTGLVNNSSRWGMRGSEDLGGGLKAGFVLESGFNSATGAAASTFFGRQSEVNLSGNFGVTWAMCSNLTLYSRGKVCWTMWRLAPSFAVHLRAWPMNKLNNGLRVWV